MHSSWMRLLEVHCSQFSVHEKFWPSHGTSGPPGCGPGTFCTVMVLQNKPQHRGQYVAERCQAADTRLITARVSMYGSVGRIAELSRCQNVTANGGMSIAGCQRLLFARTRRLGRLNTRRVTEDHRDCQQHFHQGQCSRCVIMQCNRGPRVLVRMLSELDAEWDNR